MVRTCNSVVISLNLDPSLVGGAWMGAEWFASLGCLLCAPPLTGPRLVTPAFTREVEPFGLGAFLCHFSDPF